MSLLRLLLLASALSACAAPAFDLEGHRGARGLAPENTLPAFAIALSLGVATLEMDTGVTSDGVVVVSHDETLNPAIARGPDGRWLDAPGPAIHSLAFAQLERYDVGRLDPQSRYARGFPAQAPVDGTRIPRLSEVFALARSAGNDDVRFNIETKLSADAPQLTLAPGPFARALVAQIRRAGMERRSMIQSFDWRTLQAVQREAPRIPTVYLTAQQRFQDNVCTGPHAHDPQVAPADCGPSAWTAGFQLREHGSVPRMVKAAGGHAWSPYFGDVDAGKVAEAHALGLAVIVWTVNQPADMERMIELGVDGLITDRPDVARAVMAKRGMKLPRPTPLPLKPPANGRAAR